MAVNMTYWTHYWRNKTVETHDLLTAMGSRAQAQGNTR
jgi:hypothetical protein